MIKAEDGPRGENVWRVGIPQENKTMEQSTYDSSPRTVSGNTEDLNLRLERDHQVPGIETTRTKSEPS